MQQVEAEELLHVLYRRVVAVESEFRGPGPYKLEHLARTQHVRHDVVSEALLFLLRLHALGAPSKVNVVHIG